jgi:hypothetical protein
VWVTAGEYVLDRPLRLDSGMGLFADPEAVFRLANGAAVSGGDCMIGNQDPEHGNRDIEVRGGVWDGNNPGNPRGEMFSQGYSGALMDFRRVENLTLTDLVLRDSEAFYIRLGEVTHFRVERIRFEAEHLRPNQDGVHLGGGCEDGEIHGLQAVGKGVTGDDLLALNADDALNRVELRGLVNAPIRRIRASELEAEDCHTFVRILSIRSAIEDVEIQGIRGGCGVACLNMDGARFCVVPLFDPEDPAFADGVGDVRRVRIADVKVFASRPGEQPLFDLLTRARDFVISDVQRDLERDLRPEAPTLRWGKVPGGELTLEGAKGGEVYRCSKDEVNTHPAACWDRLRMSV